MRGFQLEVGSGVEPLGRIAPCPWVGHGHKPLHHKLIQGTPEIARNLPPSHCIRNLPAAQGSIGQARQYPVAEISVLTASPYFALGRSNRALTPATIFSSLLLYKLFIWKLGIQNPCCSSALPISASVSGSCSSGRADGFQILAKRNTPTNSADSSMFA